MKNGASKWSIRSHPQIGTVDFKSNSCSWLQSITNDVARNKYVFDWNRSKVCGLLAAQLESFTCAGLTHFQCRVLCRSSIVCFEYPGPSRRGGRGGKRSRARAPKGPVNILCHKIWLLLCISAVHFYGNSAALKGYLQEPSNLMTVLM